MSVPLMVSHRRLADRKTLPRAAGRWVLDSGGFSELTMYGGWRTSPDEYVDATARYRDQIGGLDWAAPQDWMCEPHMTARTGLSVREHQERTVASYLQLRDTGLPFIPVLQGWTLTDYLTCVDLYTQAGVDLRRQPTVGVGSVCKRQDTDQIGVIVDTLNGLGLRLHGFGVKTEGLARYGDALASSDSLAWSYNARRNKPLKGCRHKSCANCPRWALAWRQRALTGLNSIQLRIPAGGHTP